MIQNMFSWKKGEIKAATAFSENDSAKFSKKKKWFGLSRRLRVDPGVGNAQALGHPSTKRGMTSHRNIAQS